MGYADDGSHCAESRSAFLAAGFFRRAPGGFNGRRAPQGQRKVYQRARIGPRPTLIRHGFAPAPAARSEHRR